MVLATIFRPNPLLCGKSNLPTSIYELYRRRYAHTQVTLDNIFSEENQARCQKIFKERPLQYGSAKLGEMRQSAVLVPLCHVNGEPSVLFMVRSRHVPSHRGDVSCPGGMADESDDSLVTTALREAHEEVGLDTSSVNIWGPIGCYPTRNKIMVTPIVAYCGEIDVASLKPCAKEVESVFTRTISSLCAPENTRQTTFNFRGFRAGAPNVPGFTMPVYLGGEHRIWGLTATFLHNLLTVLAPGLYTFKLRHPRMYSDRNHGKKAR